MKSFSILTIAVVQCLLLSPQTQASESQPDPLADLLQVLDQETDIATKTKLNIDFVPGMVTVLEGRDLQLKGFETVFEALATVPGIELSLTGDGQWQVMVRGVGKSFASAKVKILLNGVPFNATMNAVSIALVTPINFVDRIEVIRGPGSALYGEFASVGVINIITQKQAGGVFVNKGSNNSYTLGGQSHYRFDNGLLADFSFSEYAKKAGDVESGQDWFASNPADISPGTVNNSEHHKIFNINVALNQFELKWQFSQRSFGDYFGLSDVLSDSESPNRQMTMHGLDLSHQWAAQPHLNSQLNIGWLNFSLKSDPLMLFPAGTAFPWGANFPDGVLASPNYEEDRYYIRSEWEYSGIDSHQILFGLDYSKTTQGETFAVRNYNLDVNDRIVNAPYQRYTGNLNWMAEGLSRQLFSVYLQDQFSLSDTTRLTGGLRFEDYSDVGGEVLPRLAVVYNPIDHHIFKMQYARSFRPPTFMEMHVQNNAVVKGNPNLRSEIFDNYELAYVFNNGLNIFRATLFYYQLKNMIVINSTSKTYENQGELNTRGAELEFKSQLMRDITLDAGMLLSHNRGKDEEVVPGSANLNANVGVIATPWPLVSLSGVVHYVGERKRQANDSRGDLKADKVFDLSVQAQDVLLAKSTLRFVVKNLFDEDVHYPSLLVRTAGGDRPGYEEDYPQSGRRFMLQMDLAF